MKHKQMGISEEEVFSPEREIIYIEYIEEWRNMGIRKMWDGGGWKGFIKECVEG
ncbi:hypothetical protein GMJAKD_11420 [Candidatus Electrothrix aarhusensis]